MLPSSNAKALAKFSDRPIIVSIQNYRKTETYLKHVTAATGLNTSTKTPVVVHPQHQQERNEDWTPLMY
jgi:hypothetical protein